MGKKETKAAVQETQNIELPKYKCIKCSSTEFFREVLYVDKESQRLIIGQVCKSCFKEQFNTD